MIPSPSSSPSSESNTVAGVLFLLLAAGVCCISFFILWQRERARRTRDNFHLLSADPEDTAQDNAAEPPATTTTAAGGDDLSRRDEIRHSIIAAVLLGAINSYNTTIIGGLAKVVVKKLVSTETKSFASLEGLLVSCLLLGGLGGALIAPPIADRIGRPGAITVCGVCATFFPVLLAVIATTNFALVVLVRTCVGVAVGMSAVLGPLYISERAPLDIRGKLGTCYQVAVCVFVLFAELVNFWSNPESRDDISNVLLQLQFGLFSLIGVAIVVYSLWFMPDVRNPSLVGSSRKTQSTGSTSSSSVGGRDEMSCMEKLRDIDTRWWILIVVLPATQQLTGINAVVLYGPQILKLSFTNFLLVTFLCIGTWNLLSVFVSFVLIERVGRRVLMLVALAGMSLSLLFMGIVFASLPLGHASMGSLTLLGIMTYIFFFEIGPGPLFFVMASESFPKEIKSNAIGMSNALTWIYNILVVFSFPPLTKAFGDPAEAVVGTYLLGTAVMFVVFSVVSAGCLWVVWQRVP